MAKVLDVQYAASGQPVKSGTLQFLQDSYNEQIAATIVGATGATFDATKIYRLYGIGVTTVAGNYVVTAGAVYYGGQIYLCNGGTYPIVGGAVFKAQSVGITQYTTNADPVTFYDASVHNIHNIRKMTLTLGTSGTGFFISNTTGGTTPSALNDITSWLPWIGNNIDVINAFMNSVYNPGWQTLALTSGYVALGGGQVQYNTNGFFDLYLRGTITNPVTPTPPSNTLFTIPIAAISSQPLKVPVSVYAAAGGADQQAYLDIDNITGVTKLKYLNGADFYLGYVDSFIFLDGIRFSMA
jgi:hypothetical protein